MKDFKEKLLSEMDERVPSMSDRLKDYPITVKEQKSFTINWKIFTPILTVFIIALIVIPFLFPEKPSGQVYMIEVNPTIIISTNEKDEVTEIKSGNKDADEVLISLDLNSLIGQDLASVAKVIADELLQLGYFDANGANVMRISSTKQEHLNTLFTDYFNEQGYFVMVLDEEINLEDFNDKFNAEVDEIKDLYNYVLNLKDSYLANQDIPTEKIAEIYKEQYLKNYFEVVLNQKMETITETVETLSFIQTTYNDILSCDEIPFFARDYWLARSYYEIYPEKLTDEVQTLMTQMQTLLDRYYELTGQKIISAQELLEAYTKVTSISIAKLMEIMSDLSSQINTESGLNELITFLEALLPSITEELEDLKNIPESIEQLFAKIKTISLKNNEAKKAEYQDEYQKEKTEIRKEEYANRLNEIIQEFGSLKNYWQNLQK